MTDEITREEFEALQERVQELEEQLESPEAPTAEGMDHRDRKVLAHMRENEKVDGYSLVKLYTTLTDITDRGTAKNRAKQLAASDAYEAL